MPARSKPKTSPQVNPSDVPEAAENMPQWLRDFAAASSNEPNIQEDPKPGAPEASVRPAPPPAVPASPPAPSISPVQAAPATPPVPAPPEEDDSELPDWLRSASIENYIEPEAPQRDILDWLKGPAQVDTELPNRPTFGDVDVEERLSFAFDEPQDTPSATPVVPERLRSGLTNILGFSPYAPDEVMGQSETPLLVPGTRNSGSVPAGACLRIRRRRRITVYTGLYGSPGSCRAGRTGLCGYRLRPWLEGLQPPFLETSPAQDEPSAIGETISPNMPADLKPWLIGLQPPVLEASLRTLRPAGSPGGR